MRSWGGCCGVALAGVLVVGSENLRGSRKAIGAPRRCVRAGVCFGVAASGRRATAMRSTGERVANGSKDWRTGDGRAMSAGDSCGQRAREWTRGTQQGRLDGFWSATKPGRGTTSRSLAACNGAAPALGPPRCPVRAQPALPRWACDDWCAAPPIAIASGAPTGPLSPFAAPRLSSTSAPHPLHPRVSYYCCCCCYCPCSCSCCSCCCSIALLHPPSDCCHLQMPQLSAPSDPADSPEPAGREEYEARHVHQVYEQIASHFSATRFKVPFSTKTRYGSPALTPLPSFASLGQ